MEDRTRCKKAERTRVPDNPYSDYNPTLLARLADLPLDDPLQLSDFDPYTLPIGYNSYITLDCILVILGSGGRTPQASQGS